MTEEKLTIDDLEKAPVSGAGSNTTGSSTRMDENKGLSEAEMKAATGGRQADLDGAGASLLPSTSERRRRMATLRSS